ncbi:MAG: histidine phosphatase family protein [Acidobacteria bacterium]|nr:histidine phosphatase family protein [Acidobacteriota bacterium]
MRRYLTAATLLILAGLAPLAAEETLLLFARHAEKESSADNPNLTARGLQRAEALADIAMQWNVAAAYATDFCRTAQTAQPTAARVGMPITVQPIAGASGGLDDCTPPISSPAFFLDPGIESDADLLSWILEQHGGGTVLIVGHSNTVPRMLAQLGLGSVSISDDQYDRLFMVTYDSKQGARMVERSYGETGPDEEPAAPRPVERLPIVDQAIAFHGGPAYASSTTRLTISSRSGSFALEVRRDGTLFDYRVEDTRDGRARRTRVDNEGVERLLAGEPQELAADAAQRARDFVSARVYFPFLPYGLNDPDVFKTDQGLEDWDGRTLHRVKVTFTAGSSTDADDDYAYWFDPETGRLEQYAYSFGNGTERGGLRFRRLSNYRRVGGILFFDASNIGFDDAGDFSVDAIDPAYVEERMQPISQVVLSAIEVAPLD